MNKSIVVSVASDGTVTIEAMGFKGQACEQATRAIEQAMGTTGKRTKKPEFFQANTQTQKASN